MGNGEPLDRPLAPRVTYRREGHTRGHLNRSCLRTTPALTCHCTKGVPCDVVLQEVLRDH
jgi:hypothetical protein